MRFFTGGNQQARAVRWYFPENDNPPLPFNTSFGSRNWSQRVTNTNVVGEIGGRVIGWSNGDDVWGLRAFSPCGTSSQFRDGVPGPVVGFDRFVCCGEKVLRARLGLVPRGYANAARARLYFKARVAGEVTPSGLAVAPLGLVPSAFATAGLAGIFNAPLGLKGDYDRVDGPDYGELGPALGLWGESESEFFPAGVEARASLGLRGRFEHPAGCWPMGTCVEWTGFIVESDCTNYPGSTRATVCGPRETSYVFTTHPVGTCAAGFQYGPTIVTVSGEVRGTFLPWMRADMPKTLKRVYNTDCENLRDCEIRLSFRGSSESSFTPAPTGVTTNCCVQTIPQALMFHFRNVMGCACLNNAGIAINYNSTGPDAGTWTGSGNPCGGANSTVTVKFDCFNTGVGWRFRVRMGGCYIGGYDPGAPIQSQCSPLFVKWQGAQIFMPCCPGGMPTGGDFEVTPA